MNGYANTRKVKQKLYLEKRDHKRYNTEIFRELLWNCEWNYSISDTNTIANRLTDTLVMCLDQICPIRRFSVIAESSPCHWFNEKIDQLIRQRDEKYQVARLTEDPEIWADYKQLRNEVVSVIRAEKEKFFRKFIDDNRGEPVKLWKNLKTLLPNPNEISNITVTFSDIKIRDTNEIATMFNQYFIDSIDEIIKTFRLKTPDQYIIDNPRPQLTTFEIVPMESFMKIVNNMQNTGPGPDGVSTHILKDAANVIGDRFLDVINTSLKEGKFPEIWKVSHVIPVPKIPKANKCENFRPINTVSVCEKLLELVVKKQLLQFCDTNNILVTEQSGFREKHSCESSLLNLCDNWFKDIENGKIIIAVFLDFRRAFETVNRDILLYKLSNIGITGNALRWFESYLTNRYQKVRYKNVVSSALLVSQGVPQGTVLGPLLFLLYVNDMIKNVKHCNISLFADDSMIYISGTLVDNLRLKLSEDLSNICSYLQNNSLFLNYDKCKYMIIGNNNTLREEIERSDIILNNIPLQRVSEIKYLGVIFDDRLTFHNHAKYIMNKMSKKIYLLKRIGKSLSLYTRTLLYKSLVAPHIDFCSFILNLLPAYRIKEIQIIQNRALRFVLKCNRYTPVATMLNVLNVFSVKDKIAYNSMVTVYKILNGLMPEYLRNKVCFSVHKYKLRNASNLIVNCCKTEKRNKLLFYCGFSKFNMLPLEVKEARTLTQFRHLLREYMTNVADL